MPETPPKVVLRWDSMPEALRALLLCEQEKHGDLSPERQFEILLKWLAEQEKVEGDQAKGA